jgi:hypothetical protein
MLTLKILKIMKLASTSDTSARSKVYEIADEIDIVFEQLEKKFKGVKLNIIVAFRCLPDKIGRKTFRRFDKKENALILDITVSEDKYSKLTKAEQRYHLSHTFFDYLKDSLIKYKFPGLDIEYFLEVVNKLLQGIGWLKEK